MLLALRDALDAADGSTIRLSLLARELDADPEVVRQVMTHAVARGWLPDVELSVDDGADDCGLMACRPEPTSAACRRCPMSA